MQESGKNPWTLWEIIKCMACVAVAVGISCGVCLRMISMAGVEQAIIADMTNRLDRIEKDTPLKGKKIVYDGDSITEGRKNNGGAYAAMIAELTDSTYENMAKGGALLSSSQTAHSVVDNLEKLPKDGDLYCFQGGINDYWAKVPLGTCDSKNYDSELNTKTICGAMETIFRYCLENFPGKPVCFVITHKIQKTAVKENANGDTFEDYRNAMVEVCQKYSIPYYDAFTESGLNGWNETQSEQFLTGNDTGKSDGIHPNAKGYKIYYVPQLLDLFGRMIPVK